MLRAIGLPLMCLAMFSIAGGHWAVLQTVAWAQMLKAYSSNASAMVALEKTFDGNHPCDLCRKVAEGRTREEKLPVTVKVEKKAEVFVIAVTAVLKKPPVANFSYPLLESSFSSRSDAPPVPVPRTALS